MKSTALVVLAVAVFLSSVPAFAQESPRSGTTSEERDYAGREARSPGPASFVGGSTAAAVGIAVAAVVIVLLFAAAGGNGEGARFLLEIFGALLRGAWR